MIDLVAKLNTADGPSRELDALICIATRMGPPELPAWAYSNFPEWRARPDGRVEVVHDNGTGGLHFPPLSFTNSFDVAITLLPEGVNVLDLTLSWDTTTSPGYPACSIRWFEPGDGVKDWKACTVSAKTIPITVALAAMTLRSRNALLPKDGT